MKKRTKMSRVLLPTALAILVLAVALIIFWLKAQISTPELTPTWTPTVEIPTSTKSISLIDTLQITNIPTQVSTSTLTPTAFVTENQDHLYDGVYVFSMADGDYFHLFAYNPNKLPLTRITDSNWDDINPAVSPDGRNIAYSSRQSGFWDIYVINLELGTRIQITNSPEYDGHPTWSSDSQWLAYESYVDGNLDIYIRSYSDLKAEPIRLTDDPANDFSPSWAPSPGREIAFVSNRSGNNEIWIARLDQVENRFVNISQSPETAEVDPAYSSDGQDISWTTNQDGTDQIVVYDQMLKTRQKIGFGTQSVWKPEKAELLAVISEPNRYLLTSYGFPNYLQISQLIPFTSMIRGIQWSPAETTNSIQHFIALQAQNDQPTSTSTNSPAAVISTGRPGVIPLKNVTAPYAYLISSAINAFQDLRGEIGHFSGWDFLANLESAYFPLTEPPDPGMIENWLLTGRAIEVNSLPLEAGWMVIAREDFNGQTYWRVYIKALKQDGSQGLPITSDIWDLSKRYSGEPKAYENGGAYASPPSGFWIDFTELALRFSWQKLPALSNWRTYYPATRFNQFVYSDGLDWQAAMNELYPPEALATYTPYPTSTSIVNPLQNATSTKMPTTTFQKTP
jgi:TolB protein